MWKQLSVGALIGFGLAAGSITAWSIFQQQALDRQADSTNHAVVTTAADRPSRPTAEPVVENTSESSLPEQSGRPILPTAPTLSQAENDYLYDLNQALQASEKAKMNDAARLTIGQTIAAWAEAGAGYWELRQKFDATYAAAPFDRDVYLKYAIERFAPAYIAALTEPPTVVVISRPEPQETYSEFYPEFHPAHPQLPVRFPGKPQQIPSPGKPPSDTTPGGSLIVAPESPPEIVAPPEATPTPEPLPSEVPPPEPPSSELPPPEPTFPEPSAPEPTPPDT